MSSPSFELKNQIVRAGAGAGKTTALVSQVLMVADGYLKQGKKPHIVVTTFTRKATNELRERLLLSALSQGRQELVDFVKSPSQLHISTIHGVLTLLLSQQGSALGLPPQFKIVSDLDEMILYKRKLRDLMRSESQHNQDVQTLLEITGFNQLLSAQKNYCEALLYQGLEKAFSFSDLENLKQKNIEALFSEAKELARKIRQETDKEAWLELASYLEAALITKKIDAEAMPSPRRTKESVSEETVELRKELKKRIEALSGYRFQESFFKTHELMTEAFARLGQALAPLILTEKIQKAQITMADLENLSRLLSAKSPEAVAAFSEQWDYWLIDEFQDTSPLQVEILKALMAAKKRYIVGDPQQSIYLFRGARAEVFSDMEKEISLNGGEQGLLMKNYRSQPGLLQFFNHYFTALKSQFQPMDVGYTKELKKLVAKPATIYVVNEEENDEGENNLAEYNAVLHRIEELNRLGASFESICVLARDNVDLQKLAQRAFLANIPVQLHSAGQFFERPEIRDALSLLKFLVNPHDNLNFLTLLRSPWFYLSDAEIMLFCQPQAKSYWVEAQESSLEIIVKLKSYLEQRQNIGIGAVWLQALMAHGLFDYCQTADPTGRREVNLWKLVTLLKREERKPGFNYVQFIAAHETDLSADEASSEGDATPVVEPRRVSLMTVHASKGLQFDHVIIFRMGKDKVDTQIPLLSLDEEQGRWTLALPDPEEQKMTLSLAGQQIKKAWQEKEEQEKERVLYVAMTRAIQSVTLIWNQKKRPNSWAAQCPLNLSAEADSFELREGLFFPSQALHQSKKAMTVKSPWADPAEIAEKRRVISVTALLEASVKLKTSVKDSSSKTLNVAESQLSKEDSLQALRKALHGVDIHRRFENLRYAEGDLSQFKNLSAFKEGLLLKLIKSGEVEWGFGVQYKNLLIQGQIDLWGREQNDIWIIDYKTGSQRYKEKAFQQLNLYAWALYQMKKIKKDQAVYCAVVYPSDDQIFVESAKPLAEIESWLTQI